MNVIDTRSDVTGVSSIFKNSQQLRIRLRVLDGEYIGVQSSDGVEEVLELRVTEVGVDLGIVLDTSGSETESLDSPAYICLTFCAGAERETLTESGLIDLDDMDTSGLEINNLVTEGESKLFSLNGLVDIVTGERPPQTRDRTSEHTLHGFFGKRSSVLRLLDGHRKRPRYITNDNGGADATRSIRLNPAEVGEDVTGQTLAEVLNHVVALRLSVDENVEVKRLLLLDNELDFLFDEFLILFSSNLTFAELLSGNTNLLGLGERSNGRGREERKAKVGLLASNTGIERRETVVHFGSDFGLAQFDSGVVCADRCSTRVHGCSIGMKLSTDGLGAIRDSLSNDGNLFSFLRCESEPVHHLSGEFLLGGESVRGVEERRRGSNDNPVRAESLDGLLNDGNGLLIVGLPNVTSINDTSGEDLTRSKSTSNGVKLLRVADQVDVNSRDGSNAGEDIDIVDNITKVGSQGDSGDISTSGLECRVGRLESILGSLGQIQDEDRLVYLNGVGTCRFEFLQELNVGGEEIAEKGDGLNRLTTVRLSEVKERDRTNKNRASDNTLLLSLKELADGFGVGSKSEGLVFLEGGTDVMVV